jgi:3-dehydroquinate dehydratase/shikimate dehydrogenase
MTKPRLCVTVTATSTAELRRRRDAVRDADLVELRLDGVRDPDVAGSLDGRRLPVIVTCRPTWEGGRFEGSEEARHRILGEALAHGAEYVDIEWRAGFDDLVRQAGGRRIVLSSHDFESVPADLAQRAHAMRSTGAEVIKLAVTAQRLTDCIPLAELGEAGRDGGAVLIAMGPKGLITRVLPCRFCSEWSYGGSLNALGQLTPEVLLNTYRFRSLTSETALYGLVGSPLDHSVSPDMHNAAFKAASIDAVSLPLPAADADDFVKFAHAFGVKGASVTIPFKVSLFEHVDAVPVARRVGAINTISLEHGRWVGDNTDVAGFLRPLMDAGVPLTRVRAAVLGSGGAARAVAVGLGDAGASVTIHARDAGRAQDTARAVGVQAASWPPEPNTWDLLVNCTPVGMHPHVDQSPLPRAALDLARAGVLSGRYVYDLVYNPPTTRLLRDAAAAGCVAIGGLDMLVGQAQEQFLRWTATTVPASVMRGAAERKLTEFIADENHVT